MTITDAYAKPLEATYSGELKIGSLTLKVHILNNGMRIIEEQSMCDFMEWLGSGELLDTNNPEIQRELKELATFVKIS